MGLEETLSAYRMKKSWILFTNCLSRTQAIPFGLDWPIGFRRVHIFGAMGLHLTILFRRVGSAAFQVMYLKISASKSREMVRTSLTVARKIHVSSAREPKVSCPHGVLCLKMTGCSMNSSLHFHAEYPYRPLSDHKFYRLKVRRLIKKLAFNCYWKLSPLVIIFFSKICAF